MSKSPVTCHVLDSSIGKPAAGVPVQLQELNSTEDPTAGFNVLADGVTDYDGRCMQLYPEAGPGQKREDLIKLQAGKLYKVVFKTKDYFESVGRKCFYPWVEITFEVQSPTEHHHIPLLISPYSYTTYRGS
ncbi:transthyretin [Lentinus tigrinus ALCF2SS1-7]|uniref:5-hydroxyisourate hydrolase n=1 Tax=Lentinus tigrinus ALCF2SS1-6 TaxID=1328759 RepID=A0A5C2SPW1_9APHY|nr:transthyretin [Lentinus tigrinus ALCF2SS1-6]RPD82220.1 transthyretin [Lentinus tigrinus ALCF2SS1-7]